jgi:hypothetical protein
MDSSKHATKEGFSETMVGEAVLGAPFAFALELLVLYAVGSYAMGHLAGLSQFRGGAALGRAVVCLLVSSNLIFREGAHCLACLLTRTKVLASRRSRRAGRLMVVSCLAMSDTSVTRFPQAIFGLAPILLNALQMLRNVSSDDGRLR